MTTIKSLQLPQHAPQAASSLAPPTPEHVSHASNFPGLAMGVLGLLLTALELQLTNAALNQQIEGSLGFTPDEATWITVAYTSAELIVIPLGGWLTDAFSRRRYLWVSMALFVCCSLACAHAWDLTSMIVFRTFLGLVSGTFTYSAFNMVLTYLPRAKQHIGFLLTVLPVGFPYPVGYFLAELIDGHLGWQRIYYLNVILGLLLMAGIRRWIDPQPMRLYKLKQVDWLGTIVLAISMICLVTVSERGNTENWFDSEFIVLLTLISVLFLAIFCWIELNQPQPLIDLRILRQRNFVFGNIYSVAFGFVANYNFVLVQYLGQIQGYNPGQISSVVVWALPLNPLSGIIIARFETRLVLGIGTGLFLISCFMNSTLDYYVAHDQLILSQVIKALGLPFLGAVIPFAATENIKKEQFNDASAIFNLIRSTATTMAGAGINALITKREQYHSNIIVDSVSIYNHPTQARLQQLGEFFTGKLGDPHAAQSQALQSISETVRQQAYIIAYSDCFYVIGVAIMLGAIFSTPFFTKIKKPADITK
jgi:DHA2 family multidrug resistance protein